MNVTRKFLASEESFENNPIKIVKKENTNQRLGRIPEILQLYIFIGQPESDGRLVYEWTMTNQNEFARLVRIFYAKNNK